MRFQAVVENFFLHDCAQQASVGCVHVLVKRLFKIADLIYRKVVEEPAGTGENNQNLFGEWQGRKLILFEKFNQTLAAVELRLRGFVEIAAKLRKCGQFAVLGEFQF